MGSDRSQSLATLPMIQSMKVARPTSVTSKGLEMVDLAVNPSPERSTRLQACRRRDIVQRCNEEAGCRYENQGISLTFTASIRVIYKFASNTDVWSAQA